MFLNTAVVLQIILSLVTHFKLMSDNVTAASLTCVLQKSCLCCQPVHLWEEQVASLARRVWVGSSPLHQAARNSITTWDSRRWAAVSSQRMRWLLRQAYCRSRKHSLLKKRWVCLATLQKTLPSQMNLQIFRTVSSQRVVLDSEIKAVGLYWSTGLHGGTFPQTVSSSLPW